MIFWRRFLVVKNFRLFFVTKTDFGCLKIQKGGESVKELDEIYEKYAGKIYLYILKLCGNESIAEEIMQNTFLKAIENADSFEGRCEVTTWLCRIAKNEYLNFIKRRDNNNLPLEDERVDADGDIMIHLENKEAADLPQPYCEFAKKLKVRAAKGWLVIDNDWTEYSDSRINVNFFVRNLKQITDALSDKYGSTIVFNVRHKPVDESFFRNSKPSFKTKAKIDFPVDEN